MSEITAAPLSERDRNAVDSLRGLMGCELPAEYDDDFSLLRWLAAWGYNEDIILPKLREALKFRKAMGLDKVPREADVNFHEYLERNFSEAVVKYYPGGVCGYDKSGNVLVIEPMGRVDSRGFAPCCRCSEFIKCRLVEAERIWQLVRAQERATGKHCGVVYIIDLQGMSFEQIWMPTMQVYLTVLTHLQSLYPELLRKLLIIRAPAIFNAAYKIVYPVLSKLTRSKIQIIGGDEWKNKLLESVSVNTLPAEWGGKVVGVDGNPFGPIRPAGKIPAEIKNDWRKTFEQPPQEEIEVFSVARGANKIICIEMETQFKSVSWLRWYFKVDSGDIFFSIQSAETDSNIEKKDEMNLEFPKLRLNTEFVPEYGSLEIPIGKSLKFFIEFDNGHSLIKSKTVQYTAKIVS